MKKPLLVLLVPLLLISGCFQIIAVRTVGGLMDLGFEAFNEEGDLQLAHEALASNLKLLEALVKADPENPKLLLLASQGYSAYALAFAEDDSLERARLIYDRARNYGLRVLNLNPKLKAALDADLETFRLVLHSLSKEDVPAVFWTAFGWGSYINITRTDVGALADLPKVLAMMEFVTQTDSAYYFGGGYLFLGAIEGSTPAVLGGKPAKAKEYFERALAMNGGKFLMTYVYYAKTYAVQIQDQELFESMLTKVDEASTEVLPEARLPNAVAKRKARLLRDRIGEFF